MKNSLSDALSSAANAVQETRVSPVWSGDSARGALVWIGLTFLAGALGGLASTRAAQFYGALQLPPWAPPASVFGPVWGALYVLMALAAWLVWRHRRTVHGASGLTLYGMALVPNALWSWLFFHWHLGLWALMDVVLLWLLVALTVGAFWRVRPLFGMLMVPLWAWVTFAGALNLVVWRTNPALLG